MAIIETVEFELGAGASEADFLAADARVQTEFWYQQPGIVRRTTARGLDGGWLTELWWLGPEQADAAWSAVGRDEATAAFAGLVDLASVRRRRFATLD